MSRHKKAMLHLRHFNLCTAESTRIVILTCVTLLCGIASSDHPTLLLPAFLGQSALLYLDGQSVYPASDVLWKRGNQLRGKWKAGKCAYGCTNKSQLFPNGSFWLKHVQKEDEGTYSVELYNATGIRHYYGEISLIIISDSPNGTVQPLPVRRISVSVLVLICSGVTCFVLCIFCLVLCVVFWTKGKTSVGGTKHKQSITYAQIQNRRRTEISHTVLWNTQDAQDSMRQEWGEAEKICGENQTSTKSCPEQRDVSSFQGVLLPEDEASSLNRNGGSEDLRDLSMMTKKFSQLTAAEDSRCS